MTALPPTNGTTYESNQWSNFADGKPNQIISYPDKSFDKQKPQHFETVTKLLEVI